MPEGDSERSSWPPGLAGQLLPLSSFLQGSILNRLGPSGVYREETDRPLRGVGRKPIAKEEEPLTCQL